MIHKIFISAALLFLVFGLSDMANAQDEDNRCHIEYEMIFNLDVPNASSYPVWDTIWGGVKEVERFERAIMRADGMVFLAGRRDAMLDKPERIIFAQTRRHGRVKWYKEHPLPGVKSVVKVLKRNDGGYLVVANVDTGKGGVLQKSVWIGFVSEEGDITHAEFLKHNSGLIQAFDIIAMPAHKATEGRKKPEGVKYLLSASVPVKGSGLKVSHDDEINIDHGTTVLYVLNDKGKALSRRSLIMGPGNRILDLSVIEQTKNLEGGFLGVGYSYDVHKRKMGWIVRLDNEGGLLWQRQYPRGAGAELSAGQTLREDAFVMTGTAAPLVRDGKRAAWVMAVKRSNGDVIWQRYFAGEPDFFGRDLLIGAGDVISVLLDGDIVPVEDAEEKDVREQDEGEEENAVVGFDDLSGIGHVRVMELDPRGNILEGSAYYNGDDVDAYQLLRGPEAQRILIGGTDALYKQKDEGGNDIEPKKSLDAWFISAVPEIEFEDECVVKPYRTP